MGLCTGVCFRVSGAGISGVGVSGVEISGNERSPAFWRHRHHQLVAAVEVCAPIGVVHRCLRTRSHARSSKLHKSCSSPRGWCAGVSASGCGFGVRGGEIRVICRNVQRFRGGLVFKAHRLWYHSTLGWRVIKKKKERQRWARLRIGECCNIPFASRLPCSPQRALPTEKKVECGTSQSKSGTSGNLRNRGVPHVTSSK